MSPKAKKILMFTGIGIDVALTLFLFVIAIIMIITMPGNRITMAEAVEKNGPFIGYLQQHPTVYFWSCVFPLILLLIANLVILVLFVRALAKKKQMAVEDLSEEQKAALRAELLKELQAEQSESKEPEDK
jgi:hypothetical protein